MAILVAPAMPGTATEVWRRIGLEGDPNAATLPGDAAWGGYEGGTAVVKGEPLFPRRRRPDGGGLVRLALPCAGGISPRRRRGWGRARSVPPTPRRCWPGRPRRRVDRLICIGTGPADVGPGAFQEVARATARAGVAPRAWASIGLHPHEASEGVDEVAALRLQRVVREGDPSLVAVGECGLDYHYEHSPRRGLRRAAFACAWSRCAHEYGLALVIPRATRGTTCFDVLAARSVPERTVLHCFTGGPDEGRPLPARRACSASAFSGIVTFKNAADVRAAAGALSVGGVCFRRNGSTARSSRQVAASRGQTGEPSYVSIWSARAIAAVKQCTVDEVRERTAASTAMVFSTGA